MPNLPDKLTASQVIARVNQLWDSTPMTAYRTLVPKYRRLVLLQDSPEMPDDWNQGNHIDMPVPDGIHVVWALKNDTAPYPVYIDAYPRSPKTGVPTKALSDKGDKAGRLLAMLDAKLDEGAKITSPVRDRQLVDGVLVLVPKRRRAPGSGECSWEVEVCSVDTSCWPEKEGGAYIPSEFGRRYKQYVRFLQGKYNNRGRHKGEALQYKDGMPSWVAMAAPRAVTDPPSMGAGTQTASNNEEADFYYYDDGYYIYHVCASKDGSGGEILYCERNTTYWPGEDEEDEPDEYLPAAVVVAGHTLSVGGDGGMCLPVLFPLLNNISSRNLVRKIRASLAARDRTDMILPTDLTPEELEEAQQKNMVQPAKDTSGSAGLTYAAGAKTAVPWEYSVNPDLDKIAVELQEEAKMLIASYIVDTSGQVVATSTAEAYHTSTGITDRQKTSWLKNKDNGMALIYRMIVNATINEADEYPLTASERRSLRNGDAIDQGEYLMWTPDDLDFDFDISVQTTQETEDQKARRLLNAVWREQNGIGTHDQVIEEYTPDVVKQNKLLAIDAGKKIAQPVMINAYLPQAIEEALATDPGWWMPFAPGAFLPPDGSMGMPPQLGPGQPDPNAPTNVPAAATMAAARATDGAGGGGMG